MDTIYIAIKVKKNDAIAEQLREEGLFFSSIADSIGIEREAITEIDETNYKKFLKKFEK
ncbi:MAG: hypothetical protein GX121_01885 [Ignavibacteria bacterium]|nr:hypothetical protein [Ignavibacteria bacterium]